MPKRTNDSEIIFYLYEIFRNEAEIEGEINIIRKLKEKGLNITPLRLRKIIFEIPEIRVIARYSKRVGIHKNKCPVCGEKLYPFRGITLEGKRRILGYKCRRCNFNTLKDGKPLLYSFKWMKHDI